MTSPKYTPSETQICQSFIDFVAKAFPGYLPDIIKIDNEGRTSWTEGKRKKAEGKKKGASDYFIAIPTIQYLFKVEGYYEEERPIHGLWLEFKTAKGRESPEQKAFGEARKKRGYAYMCVYSIDEAMAVFQDYLNGHIS